jgi:hypothetical protein
MPYCEKCGNKSSEADRFCEHCGAALVAASTVEPEAARRCERQASLKAVEIARLKNEGKGHLEEKRYVLAQRILKKAGKLDPTDEDVKRTLKGLQPFVDTHRRKVKICIIVGVMSFLLAVGWCCFQAYSSAESSRWARLESQKREEKARKQKRLESLERERLEKEAAEQRRKIEEDERIARTRPIEQFDLGSEFLQAPNGITSQLEGQIPVGTTREWRMDFVDRSGTSHRIGVKLYAKSSGLFASCPVWSLTVDGKTISRDMQGYGHWPGKVGLRIDPVVLFIDVTGFTSGPAVRIHPKLYRTDYGAPEIKCVPDNGSICF